MTIELAPEIEAALVEEARRQGTTAELLALDYLRQRFVSTQVTGSSTIEQGTLADFLEGYIGVLASGEFVSGGANCQKTPVGNLLLD